jgi:hypothetical protein
MLIGSASKSPIAGRGPSISEAAEQDLANEHILAIDPHADEPLIQARRRTRDSRNRGLRDRRGEVRAGEWTNSIGKS